MKATVVVLHTFLKKTQATSRPDIELARTRSSMLDKEKQVKPLENKAAQVRSEPIESYASVWDAIADTPEQATNLRVRSQLIRQIATIVKGSGRTQTGAAQRCGVTQPRMNDLLRGRVSRFSLDALVNIATAIGRKVYFELQAA